jgi:hypothetical protein
MKNIEPVNVWVNGEVKIANKFQLAIVSDNLKDSATFYYQLLKVIEENDEFVSQEQLTQGNVSVSGQEYLDWSNSEDVNNDAFVLVAEKLNLILLP